MTTNNIDELIEVISNIRVAHGYVQGYLTDAVEALRSQKQRNEELFAAANLYQTEAGELQAKLSAIQRATEDEENDGYFKVKNIKAILDTMKDSPVCKDSLPPVDSEPAQQPEQGSKE